MCVCVCGPTDATHESRLNSWAETIRENVAREKVHTDRCIRVYVGAFVKTRSWGVNGTYFDQGRGEERVWMVLVLLFLIAFLVFFFFFDRSSIKDWLLRCCSMRL